MSEDIQDKNPRHIKEKKNPDEIDPFSPAENPHTEAYDSVDDSEDQLVLIDEVTCPNNKLTSYQTTSVSNLIWETKTIALRCYNSRKYKH